MDKGEIIESKDIDEKINLFDTKITYFILDMDNSKELFGNELPEDVTKSILLLMLDIFFGAYISKVGRDAVAGMYCGEHLSIFDIAKIKDHLQNDLSKKFKKNITFCMGISIYPDVCKQKNDIRDYALDALFTAKQKGANNIEISNEENMELKSIYFRKNQLKKLSYLSKKTGKTEAEIIRKAVDQYLEEQLLK